MEAKIYKAMINVMNEVKAISKEKQTSGYASFKYRGIDDVYNALNPVMAKCGIFCIPELVERNREERTNKDGKFVAYVTVKVKYTFYAEDGSSVSCITAGEGMDSGDKATSKALSIAMKYALFQTFCIPTEDMPDPDAETDHFAPKQEEKKKAEERHMAERQAAKVENNNPITEGQQKAFWASMAKYKSQVANKEEYARKAYEVLGEFFGRTITTLSQITKDEMSEYLSSVQTPDNPF